MAGGAGKCGSGTSAVRRLGDDHAGRHLDRSATRGHLCAGCWRQQADGWVAWNIREQVGADGGVGQVAPSPPDASHVTEAVPDSAYPELQENVATKAVQPFTLRDRVVG